MGNVVKALNKGGELLARSAKQRSDFAVSIVADDSLFVNDHNRAPFDKIKPSFVTLIERLLQI